MYNLIYKQTILQDDKKHEKLNRLNMMRKIILYKLKTEEYSLNLIC